MLTAPAETHNPDYNLFWGYLRTHYVIQTSSSLADVVLQPRLVRRIGEPIRRACNPET